MLHTRHIALNNKKVITIDAVKMIEEAKLRVAAYARVSSDSTDQLNSFVAQTNKYISLITNNENWTLVDIYADEGITGTSADKRDDFQRMLADCRKGLIDRILVKSISRFARNTKECLEAVRELKSIGVTVYFEEQNIDTGTMNTEFMAALQASIAQTESESISGNMRWSYQRRMESGQFNTCKAPFGYRLQKDTLVIDEYEAAYVRLIFALYLEGKSRKEIASYLSEINAPTRKDVPGWKESTVSYILHNERYAGNALLAKKITTDDFPRKKVRNHGEREQYYVVNSHPAILDTGVFEKAQALSNQRLSFQDCKASDHVFRTRITCAKCGSIFKRRKVGEIEYWVCKRHFESKDICPVQQIPSAEFEKSFCRLYYKLKHQSGHIFGQMLTSLQFIRNRRMLWSPDIVSLNKRISELSCQNQTLAFLKQQSLVDPDIFISQTNELTKQLRQAKLEKEKLMDAESDMTAQRTQEIIDLLEIGPDFLDTFDAELFGELIDKIIVESNDSIRFRLKNGLELRERIERTVR